MPDSLADHLEDGLITSVMVRDDAPAAADPEDVALSARRLEKELRLYVSDRAGDIRHLELLQITKDRADAHLAFCVDYPESRPGTTAMLDSLRPVSRSYMTPMNGTSLWTLPLFRSHLPTTNKP